MTINIINLQLILFVGVNSLPLRYKRLQTCPDRLSLCLLPDSEIQLPEPAAAQTCPLPEEVTSTFSIEGEATTGASIRYGCLSG